MSKKDEFDQLLPLTPAVFHILLALFDEPRHGYGIMQEITLQTQGKLRLGPGTLYGTIKRMLAEGWIEEVTDPANAEAENERRRYYRLTQIGQRLAEVEAERLAQLVQVAESKHLLKRPGLAEGNV